MPQIVFGSLSIVAALLSLYLPETNHRSLPETIEDGENFGKYVVLRIDPIPNWKNGAKTDPNEMIKSSD